MEGETLSLENFMECFIAILQPSMFRVDTQMAEEAMWIVELIYGAFLHKKIVPITTDTLAHICPVVIAE